MPTTAPGGSEAARRLMLLSATAFTGLVATYAFFVHTAAGQRIDNALLAGQQYDLGANTSAALELLRSVTVGALFVAVAATVAVPLLRRRPRLAVAIATFIGASLLANELLKEYLLSRPVLDDVPLYLQQNSFPSGHATAAMAAGVGLVMGVPYRLRGVAGLFAAGFATVIGTATMRAAWHRLSDLIGSYLLVLAIAAAVAAALAFWRGAAPGPRPPSAAQRPLPGWATGLLAAVASIGVLGGLVVAAGTLAVTVLQGDYDLRGTRSVDMVSLAFWVVVLGVGVLSALRAARRPLSRRRYGGVVAAGLTGAGVTALAGGALTLVVTWHELTIGFPGEVALLWAYRLAAFAGHGVCFLAVAALLAALGPAELDPPRRGTVAATPSPGEPVHVTPHPAQPHPEPPPTIRYPSPHLPPYPPQNPPQPPGTRPYGP